MKQWKDHCSTKHSTYILEQIKYKIYIFKLSVLFMLLAAWTHLMQHLRKQKAD